MVQPVQRITGHGQQSILSYGRLVTTTETEEHGQRIPKFHQSQVPNGVGGDGAAGSHLLPHRHHEPHAGVAEQTGADGSEVLFGYFDRATNFSNAAAKFEVGPQPESKQRFVPRCAV